MKEKLINLGAILFFCAVIFGAVCELMEGMDRQAMLVEQNSIEFTVRSTFGH